MGSSRLRVGRGKARRSLEGVAHSVIGVESQRLGIERFES
jgi:hypothetical protein